MIENVTRRDLLKLAAAGSLPLIAPRIAWGQAASPIVKPLPPEWFVVHGTNAEMRWEAARRLGHLIPSERFFVRDHTRTPSDRSRDVAADRPRRRRAAAARRSATATSSGCPRRA